MQHVIFVYYIASLASGLAGIALSFLYYLRTRTRIVGYYLAILLLFTAYLLLLNIHYYQRLVVPLDSAVVRMVAEAVASLASGGLYFLVPAALHLFIGKRMTTGVFILFLCVALFPPLQKMTGYFIHMPWSGIGLPNVLAYLVAGFIFIFLIRERHAIEPSKRGLVRLFLAAVTAFIAVQINDDVQGMFNPGNYPITAMPLFYFLCNAASVVVIFRALITPPAPKGERMEAVAEKYKISGREREVIELILEGYANKQIAGRLGVSFSTVKNHIYSIFQKTGARSKVELFRLVEGAAEASASHRSAHTE